METASRYFETIEALMVENSRLKKEVQSAVEGKMPANIVSSEMAEQCFMIIARILGPTARGTLYDEVNLLCNEFLKIANEQMKASMQAQQLTKEKAAIEKAVKGQDFDDYDATELTNKVAKLHGVLEVIKTRLDRLCRGDCQSEISDLRKSVADFLGGV